MSHSYFVYLMTTQNNRGMYVGVTNNLERRVWEYQNGVIEGFTKKYNVKKLVYFEETTDVHAALAREIEIKKWRRSKKNSLVIAVNPKWNDLRQNWEPNL